MKLLQIKFISILHFINLIYFSHQQQQNIIQSDKILIKNVQEVWESTKIGGNQSRNYNLDISSGKFKNQPKIAYALTVYNADNCSNQGFKLSTNTITVSKLNYKLSSLGCDLTQLAFNVLFLDDPRVEIQQKELSSGVPSTIIGTQDILEIAPFIYGFKGNSSGNLILKYTLTKVDSRNYKILFSNQNVPTVYLNIIIVYQNVSQDKFEQLYSYQTNFDTQGKNIGGSSTVAWKTSTKMDLSPIFFGLKDFSITSNGYFGIKIQSGQSPEAQNKLVHLNYFTWNDYYVNLINGIWMGFSLTTCKLGYTMFLNSTFNACVQSCNTVDHHYNTNSANTQPLYSTSMIICQECNSNCYGCKDGSPHVCTDCYNGIFLNPFTNTCDSVKPASTFCSTSTIAGQTFQNCLKCDSTCKECKAANHSKSCTSCNINSQNKYFYQNQCLTQQPPSTYCNNAFICNNCDPNCVSCSDSSYNCLSCKAGSYLYQNQCLGQICQQNQYLNPFTNKCELTQPAGTSCSQITTNNSTFFNCQKCDPTCKECSSPFNATSCTSCNVSSQDKYFYNQECLKSQPEKTYCDSSFICHQCDANCSQCSQSSSNCQSCITDKYLYGNKCLDIACQNNEYLNGITQKCEQAQPSGTYCNPVTQNGKNFYFCQKCDSSCKECKSPGDSKSCTICDSYSINKYYYQNQCLISQPPSTFCDQNLNCQDCNSKCISCSQSSTNCQICQSNIYFYQNQCLENPLPGTYCKSYTDCHQCDKNCKTCIDTSTNCTSCQDQQYLFQNKCYPERPNGVYCEQENKSFKCEVCSGQNCKECLLNDSSKCTSCNTNEYLYQDKCFSSQPDSTFCKNSICQSCHQSCKSCVGISDNNCTECQDNQNRILEQNQCVCKIGYYKDVYEQCQLCDSTCHTCNGPSSKDCLSCSDNKKKYQSTCYENPPPGTYCTEKECFECHKTCKDCNGPYQQNCTGCDESKGLKLFISTKTCECSVNQFMDFSNNIVECKNCDTKCKTCNGPSNTNCLSCDNFMFKNQCHEDQPPQTYCEQKICHQCIEGCLSCVNSSYCIKCLEKYYLDGQTCKRCSPNCQTCSGPDQNNCLSCQGNLELKNSTCGCKSSQFIDDSNQNSITCINCHQNCQECTGFSPNECKSCYQDKQNRYLYKNSCLDQQPIYTYCDSLTNICDDCQQNCSVCEGIGQSKCTQCQSGYFIFQGECFSQQPEKTYCDAQKVCKSCNASCQKCNDSLVCTSCSLSQYLFKDQCYESQPDKTYCIKQEGFNICKKCQDGCNQCSDEQTCNNCQADYFLYKNKCQNKKPDQTYCEGNKCLDCDPSCFSCNGPKNTDCITCQGDQEIDSLNKICICPASKFSDPSKQKYECSNCGDGCLKCSDTSTCHECGLSKITNKKLFFLDNTCQEEQPPNTYCDAIHLICQVCQNQCQQCDESLQKCLSCQNSEYLYKGNCVTTKPGNGVYCDQNNICQDCNPNCINCQNSGNECIECAKDLFLFNKKCYPEQPQGTYCGEIKENSNLEAYQLCQGCQAFNCKACNQTLDKCVACNKGQQLNEINQLCECPDGNYLVTQKESLSSQCAKCKQQNCSKCSKNECIKCLSGFKFNDKGECVYCGNSKYANSEGICNLPCKQGCKICTSQDKCIELEEDYKNCDVSCKTCTGPSASECASCSSSTRKFDKNKNTCLCLEHFEEVRQIDCKYVYQVPSQIVNAQSAIGVVHFSVSAIITVTNFIPGFSYSLGLMQILGDFHLRQEQAFSSETSVLSPFTKYNLNSLLQFKLLNSQSNTQQKISRILQQNPNESFYPINEQEKQWVLTDKIYFASNSIITLSLIMLIYLVAQAFHQYQIRTKENCRYMNIIRWNLVLFLIQISSNFMLVTLFQCQISEQNLIDWVFIGIFVLLYLYFLGYSFIRAYRSDYLDSAVSILSSGINQQHKFSRFYFLIFEVRKLIYCMMIAGSKQHLNYTIWSICLAQVVFICLAWKQKIFINKLSNIVLLTSEIIFLLIVSILGVMINMNNYRTQKILATVIVVLMIMYSIFTILALTYLLVNMIRRKCSKREDLIQSTELCQLNAKMKLLNQSLDKNKQIKWSINPLKKKRLNESSNISSILDQSLSNKQIKVQQI